MSEIIAEPKDKCPNCWKKPSLCLCEEIQVVKASHEVLILQHPQESRNPLTTARLISLTLPKTTHKVGFSWRSLSKALGRENVDPKSWAVLYLGTTKKMENLKPLPFQVVTSHGEPVSPKTIRGVVILDGNWSQSKTLWWRNPWLLKLNRIVLNLNKPSAFGKIAKQPRKNCLSSIEAITESLRNLNEPAAVPEALELILDKHIERVKADRLAGKPTA